jgi:hypothetical protein
MIGQISDIVTFAQIRRMTRKAECFAGCVESGPRKVAHGNLRALLRKPLGDGCANAADHSCDQGRGPVQT